MVGVCWSSSTREGGSGWRICAEVPAHREVGKCVLDFQYARMESGWWICAAFAEHEEVVVWVVGAY